MLDYYFILFFLDCRNTNYERNCENYFEIRNFRIICLHIHLHSYIQFFMKIKRVHENILGK